MTSLILIKSDQSASRTYKHGSKSWFSWTTSADPSFTLVQPLTWTWFKSTINVEPGSADTRFDRRWWNAPLTSVFSRPYYRSCYWYSIASVCCRRLSSLTLCIVAKRCVLEQKLVFTAYRKLYNNEKSIGTKMNDLDLCLEVVSRSRQPLRYIWCWISRKLLEIDAWFQRTTNRKWHIGYQMVTWPMTSRDTERSNSWSQ